MTTYVQRMHITSGRTVVMAVIIGLHAALIAGLMAWKIAEAVSDKNPNAIKLAWINQPEQPKPTPVITKASQVPLAPVEVTVPVPVEVDTPDVPVDSTAIAATDQSDADSAAVDTPIQYRAVRPANDYYPPQAIRMSQAGAVVVRTCVDAAGKLSSTPQVVKPNGSALLDGAAVKWASEALRFTPATRGGVAVASCKDFRVNFQLH
ncbi:MAG TPA: TonB family protein [Steroidobacteraceae bacterium]|nr:TonB family protein [Steroidobacteraceae bacterium]